MTRTKSIYLALLAVLLSPMAANADVITFTDVNLASGNPVTVDGFTTTTTTGGGSISFIGSGQFTGLHLGGANTPGLYTLNFSELITSIVIEFDALSSTGPNLPVETLFNFATNNGVAAIGYTNQFGTIFDGTTITSTENDGQGIIDFMGAAFSTFSFDHNQGFGQNGFVIERLVVTTADVAAVPEPGTLALLGIGLAGMGFSKRKKKV